MDLMFAPLRKYAEFRGRARRTEYWLWFLFRVLLFAAFLVPIVVIAAVTDSDSRDVGGLPGAALTGLVLLGLLTWLALFIPDLAVSVRRLHDANMSGWLILLHIVPLGGFVIFVFSLLDGTVGPNIYGPDPKRQATQTAALFA